MKRLLWVLGISFLLITMFSLMVSKTIQSDSPEHLIAALSEADTEERQVLLLRLTLARGDVARVVMDRLDAGGLQAGNRDVLLNLLFKLHLRTPDERIVSWLKNALASPGDGIRRQVVTGVATWLEAAQHAWLVQVIDDSSPEVRREVYLLLGKQPSRERRRWGRRSDNVWDELSDEQRARVVEACRQEMADNPDSELAELARTVVGRLINLLCEEAEQKFTTGQWTRADELLDKALALDPTHHRARISRVRQTLEKGDRTEALAHAREAGALLEIQMLDSEPTIDGDPTDPAWAKATHGSTFHGNANAWTTMPTESRTEYRIGHTEGHLHLTMINHEENLDELVTKYHSRDERVWQDDCVELYLHPDRETPAVIMIAVNSAGTILDTRNQNNRVNYPIVAAAQRFPDRGYWACEIRVPIADIGGTLDNQVIWGINIIRTRIGPASEQLALWTTGSDNHNAGRFPLAIFPDAPKPVAAEPEQSGDNSPPVSPDGPPPTESHDSGSPSSERPGVTIHPRGSRSKKPMQHDDPERPGISIQRAPWHRKNVDRGNHIPPRAVKPDG